MPESVSKGKFPIWNPLTQTLQNHYKTEEIRNCIKIVADIYSAEIKEMHLSSLVKKIAREMTKMRNPPRPVCTWIRRIISIYKCPPLCNALFNGVVSGRYAMSELANRTQDPRFKNALSAACKGLLTTNEFKMFSKQITGKIK